MTQIRGCIDIENISETVVIKQHSEACGHVRGHVSHGMIRIVISLAPV